MPWNAHRCKWPAHGGRSGYGPRGASFLHRAIHSFELGLSKHADLIILHAHLKARNQTRRGDAFDADGRALDNGHRLVCGAHAVLNQPVADKDSHSLWRREDQDTSSHVRPCDLAPGGCCRCVRVSRDWVAHFPSNALCISRPPALCHVNLPPIQHWQTGRVHPALRDPQHQPGGGGDQWAAGEQGPPVPPVHEHCVQPGEPVCTPLDTGCHGEGAACHVGNHARAATESCARRCRWPCRGATLGRHWVPSDGREGGEDACAEAGVCKHHRAGGPAGYQSKLSLPDSNPAGEHRQEPRHPVCGNHSRVPQAIAV